MDISFSFAIITWTCIYLFLIIFILLLIYLLGSLKTNYVHLYLGKLSF